MTHFQLIEKLRQAIIDEDLNNFKHLVQNSSREWCQETNRERITLLQKAIRHNNKEIFDYMLPVQDVAGLEGVGVSDLTVLLRFVLSGILWNQFREYYACELINKGASIQTVPENSHCDTFLHDAVTRSLKVTKLLLERGINVNLRNGFKRTALHEALLNRVPNTDDYEVAAALLYYGANPLIRCDKGYNAFELSILHNRIAPIQEILFNYTFDKFTRRKIHLKVLLLLAKNKSSFFYLILEHDVEFVSDRNWLELFCDLLLLDVDHLRILFRKCNSVLSKIFRGASNDQIYTIYNIQRHKQNSYFMTQRLLFLTFNFNHVLTKISFLVENDASQSYYIVHLLANVNSSSFCREIIFSDMEQADVTELLTYLFLYGLRCSRGLLNLVYTKYGYCELFKFLLHLDLEKTERYIYPERGMIMPTFIYNITFDLLKFLNSAKRYRIIQVVQLLDYFAHPKLSNYFLKRPSKRRNLSQETVRKIENHPQMPCLVELSRNAFRKYFVNKLNIKTTKQFYSLLNGLPISSVHKKIITFETKLY